jgi:hypothetical protein
VSEASPLTVSPAAFSIHADLSISAQLIESSGLLIVDQIWPEKTSSLMKFAIITRALPQPLQNRLKAAAMHSHINSTRIQIASC